MTVNVIDPVTGESVDVEDHSKNRKGVAESRDKEPDEDTSELPVLLSSNMRADPVEGVQGTYTEIVEGECARCGYDRLIHTAHTLAGEHTQKCNACGAIQDHRAEGGYRMPDTDAERASDERDVGKRLTGLTTRDMYDMEETTGMGPYVSVVGDSTITRLRKDDVADMFCALVKNDDVDLVDFISSRLPPLDRVRIATELPPDGVHLTPNSE